MTPVKARISLLKPRIELRITLKISIKMQARLYQSIIILLLILPGGQLQVLF